MHVDIYSTDVAKPYVCGRIFYTRMSIETHRRVTPVFTRPHARIIKLPATHHHQHHPSSLVPTPPQHTQEHLAHFLLIPCAVLSRPATPTYHEGLWPSPRDNGPRARPTLTSAPSLRLHRARAPSSCRGRRQAGTGRRYR